MNLTLLTTDSLYNSLNHYLIGTTEVNNALLVNSVIITRYSRTENVHPERLYKKTVHLLYSKLYNLYMFLFVFFVFCILIHNISTNAIYIDIGDHFTCNIIM